jgi:hypothetical protein
MRMAVSTAGDRSLQVVTAGIGSGLKGHDGAVRVKYAVG